MIHDAYPFLTDSRLSLQREGWHDGGKPRGVLAEYMGGGGPTELILQTPKNPLRFL